MADVFGPDFVVHWPKGFLVNESRGLEGVREAIEGIKSAFPDWHESVLDLIVGDDRVVTRYTSTGMHLGRYAGSRQQARR
ncbi:ester cyclase [Salinibacterium sp. M195]|nr:ester cyclase [Salinibacterium sp. M195]